MVKELGGKGKFANMPTEVRQEEYAKVSYVTPAQLDDTITGIDASNKKSISKTRSNLSTQK